MGVIKSKNGTTGSKMGGKFEQKRKAKWVKEKKQIWSRPRLYLIVQLAIVIGELIGTENAYACDTF